MPTLALSKLWLIKSFLINAHYPWPNKFKKLNKHIYQHYKYMQCILISLGKPLQKYYVFII